MKTYIARRILWTPVLVFIVTFITFALGRYGPGDPVEVMMGQYNDPATAERLAAEYHLDDPLITQYLLYISKAVQGDFGESYKYRNRTVFDLIKTKIPTSAKLGLAALLISIAGGLPVGLYSAYKQGSYKDSLSIGATLLGQSIPVFLTAPLMLLVFSLKLQWLPTHGLDGFFDLGIVLPSLVMGIPGIAILARLTRASTLDILSQDFVRTARAKGLPPVQIAIQHVLRNSLIPVVTTLGFSLAGLISGSFIVEAYFGIPGVGLLAVESFFARDYPVIMALVIIGTTAFAITNLLIDLMYPVLDPRIRLSGSSDE
jgi:ABC-type dipeptide/oligopeptide/nickel transport system permease component